MKLADIGRNLHLTYTSGVRKQARTVSKIPMSAVAKVGRERAWVSSDNQLASSIHSAVLRNDLDTMAKLLEANDQSIIEQKDSQGNTPLHIAARVGNLKIVEFLLEQGANDSALNNLGLSPVFEAADQEHGAVVEVLLRSMKKDIKLEDVWYSKEDIARLVDEAKFKPGKNKSRNVQEKKIDQFVHKLTGQPICDMNDRSELYKYLSHLNSWTGSTLNEQDEGWFTDRVLIQRVRSLSSILLKPESLPQDLGMPSAKVKTLLIKELAGMLNSLRSARRMNTLRGSRMGAAATRLNGYEATQFLAQILRMEPGDNYTLPIGFPGHAIYMGIEKRRNETGEICLIFHINNLGAGFPQTHDVSGKLRVLPKAFSIPLAEKNPNLPQTLAAMLNSIFRCRTLQVSADWGTLYEAISNFQSELKSMYGAKATIIDADEEGWQAMKAQTAGNCALKNHSASMATRLGKPLFKWFKSREISYVRSRSENLVDNKYFIEKEYEKDTKILENLLESRDLLGEELEAFLAKPRPNGIASAVTTQTIAQIMEDGWDASIVENLINLKANFTGKDGENNSLLHCAAKLGLCRMAEILIAKGLKVNDKNSLGRTPLHISMDLQNRELTELLINKGANPQIKDNDGLTPDQLLASRIEEARSFQDFRSQSVMRA